MRIIFMVSVIISGLITVGGIWIVHLMTGDFNRNGFNPMWSNGNPGLFFILWPMPFISYFLFSMIFVFEWVHNKYKASRKRFLLLYLLVFIGISSWTVYRVIHFHQVAQLYFEDEIGYLNPYSNHLFFNVWTFLAALCIPAIVSFYLEGKNKQLTP